MRKMKREKVLSLKRAVNISTIPGRGLSRFSKKRMRGFHYPLTIRSSTLFILLGWSWNSNSLPDEPFHVAGFGGEDFGVLGLSVPLIVEHVFRYRRIVVLPEPNLPVVLLQPGLNSAFGLSDILLAAMAGTLHISGDGVFSPSSSLHRTEEIGCLPGWQAITFDVAFGQRSTNATACPLDVANFLFLRW
jgi:hypothetical protein